VGKLKAPIAPIGSSTGDRITGKNYTTRAIAFLAGREGFVIVGPDAPQKHGARTPAQWRAWVEYFSGINLKTTFMRREGRASVPTEWPEDFDPTAPLSDRLWLPLPPQVHSDEHCAAMRARIGGLFRGLSASLDKPDPQRRRPAIRDSREVADPTERAQVEALHLARARQLASEYADQPISVSDELRHTNALRTAALLNAGQDGGDL
jgi:hypothetical protein